jgi:hypothetical protein|tara:strand:+ start:276 stop:896 length:621 start_codon:yes stop_codon:yes gene_type:complete
VEAKVTFFNYKTEFEKHYYNCFHQGKHTNKAKKDIVGKSYEMLREKCIKSYGCDIATKKEREYFKKMLGGSYDADQYIVQKHTRKLLALEEDKGHYVDKCFFKRALANATETVAYCLKNNIEIPYFILSCPTNYKDYNAQLRFLLDDLSLFDKKVVEVCKQKLKFFHHCHHGRTSRTKYLTTDKNPFIIEDNLVDAEKRFFSMIKG